MLHRTVDEGLVEFRLEALLEPVAEREQALRLFRHFLLRDFTSLAEADDSRNVQRAGAHAAFVAAAVDDGRELNTRIAAANVQSTDALRSVSFMAADGEQVDVVFLHVHRNFAYGLHFLDVKDNAIFLGDFADFRDRIDYANLVVGVHDGDQDRFWRNGLADIFRINAAILANGQVGDLVAVLFQALAGVEHSLVLDGLGNDVIALFAI